MSGRPSENFEDCLLYRAYGMDKAELLEYCRRLVKEIENERQ